MKRHPGYFQDSLTQDYKPIYRCIQCQYDSMDYERITGHIQQHPNIYMPETELSQLAWWENLKSEQPGRGKRIEIGYLTWNIEQEAPQCARMVEAERIKLAALGYDVEICWYDNGSHDSTVQLLEHHVFGRDTFRIHSAINMGQSIARNSIIDRATKRKCDYIIFIDGDIGPIPFSGHALIDAMESQTSEIGCIGLLSHNCTKKLEDCADECRKIDQWMLTDIAKIAWTQYGIFKMSMFTASGIKFDQSEAFQGDGWGLEDDDLYIQMLNSGYEALHTLHFRYYHAHRSSSLRSIDKAKLIFNRRKSYIQQKWKHSTNQKVLAHLRLIDGTHMDML